MLAGMVLLVLGIILFLLSGDSGESGGASLDTTPTNAETATAENTSAASPEPSATAIGSPAQGMTVQLFAWSRQQSRWLADLLSDEPASYREGEPVPLLTQLEGLQMGATYEISIRYQCGGNERASFDYLSDIAEADSTSLVTAPAPGRPRADTTILVPDDPSIDFDDDADGRFQLWGGAFEEPPQEPSPSSECSDTKEFQMRVTAQNPAVSLVVGAHLATADDWGEGRGASSQEEPLFSEVWVDDGEAERVEITPETVAP
jgi:hypothetical protein